MKYLTILLTAILFACDHKADINSEHMDITVIRDITDPHHLVPEADAILRLYNLSVHKNESAMFRYREIADIFLVPTENLRLPAKGEIKTGSHNQTPNYRETEILRFYDQVRKTLREVQVNGDTATKDHSECFRTIAEELRTLNGLKGKNKILLVYSNLMENSDILSVYGYKTFSEKDTAAIRKKLEEKKLLPENLNSITVFLLYQPQNRPDDYQYGLMSGVYTRMLGQRGARVKVMANTPEQQHL